jgi:hypothetical protein
MYRINTANGDIYVGENKVSSPPYSDEAYQEYASWVQIGNTPEEFYLEPLAPVPESVSRFQARVALYQAGYLDAINSLMSSDSVPMVAKLAWQDAQEFRRDSATVAAMAAALNLSEAAIDDLFRSAALVVA